MMPQPVKKIKENRTCVLPPLRVTETERDLIKAKAAECGLHLSAYLRSASLDAVIVTRNDLIDRETYRALRGIANNLNQLTRKTHIHDEYDKERLHEILSIIEEIGLRLLGYTK